jgi:hypothetical protein
MSEESVKIPEEFTKVIKDFVGDLRITFPEYEPLINKWWKSSSSFNNIEDEEERQKTIQQSETASTKLLFTFCKKKLPPRFFDILYQSDDMFKEDSTIDTEFLPHIYFKNLWQFDITQKTRDIIWKYLQLILFSIVGSLENKDAFGDSAKLFDSLDQDDFKTKLQETLSKMQGMFDFGATKSGGSEGAGEGAGEGTGLGSNINMENMPNADELHDHITGMLDGKLGKLAREIAEETAANFNMDMENSTDMNDVLTKLMQNPTKLMGLVKNVGDKLDTRIKSGEIKQSELIAEATEIMNRMKNMPGMGNIQSMLSKMGMGDLANMANMANMGNLGGKVDVGAMEAQLNRNMKLAQTKERIKAKAEASQKARNSQQIPLPTPVQPVISDEELIKIFSTGEKVDKTPRNTVQPQKTGEAKKKKKGKK